jgi:hypothetical protein
MTITNQWRLFAWNMTLRPNALVLGTSTAVAGVRAYARNACAGLCFRPRRWNGGQAIGKGSSGGSIPLAAAPKEEH